MNKEQAYTDFNYVCSEIVELRTKLELYLRWKEFLQQELERMTRDD